MIFQGFIELSAEMHRGTLLTLQGGGALAGRGFEVQGCRRASFRVYSLKSSHCAAAVCTCSINALQMFLIALAG